MKLSTVERETRSLNPDTLDAAIQQIKMNGYAVFEAALSEELIGELRTHYMELLNKNIAKNEPNRGAKRWQMHLPFRAPFNHPDVISHPIVLSVIDQLLGENCICHYLGNNTPLPGSDYQPTHSDIHHTFSRGRCSITGVLYCFGYSAGRLSQRKRCDGDLAPAAPI